MSKERPLFTPEVINAKLDSRRYQRTVAIARIAVNGLFDFSVAGSDVVEPGAGIFSPKHQSNFDVFLLGLAAGESVSFMAKDSLEDVLFVGDYAASLGTVFVERGTPDRRALDNARQVLIAGRKIALFAEGSRKNNGDGHTIGDIFDGPAMLADRTGAPLYPVGIAYNWRNFPRPRAAVSIGPPITHEDMAELTEEVGKRGLKAAASETLRQCMQQEQNYANYMVGNSPPIPQRVQ